MTNSNLAYILFQIALFTPNVFGKGLPIGDVGESARRDSAQKAVAADGCQKWYASSFGSMGRLDVDESKYMQLFQVGAGEKVKYSLEVLDINTLVSKVKMTLSIPKVDQVIFPVDKEGDGLTLIRFDNNDNGCFKGKARLTALSYGKENVTEKKLAALSDKGLITSYGMLSGSGVYDYTEKLSLRYQFDPFLRAHSKVEIETDIRMLYSDQVGGKDGYIAIRETDPTRELLRISRTGVVKDKMNLKAGDRLVRNGPYFGVIRAAASQNLLYFLENGRWSGSNSSKVYRIPVPSDLVTNHVSMLFSAKAKTLMLFSSTPLSRKKANSVYVYDYENSKLLSHLALPNDSMPGEIHYDTFGKVGVVEEIGKKDNKRKALHVFRLKNINWQKKAYE